MKASEAIKRIRRCDICFAVLAAGIPVRISPDDAVSWVNFSASLEGLQKGAIRFTEDNGEQYAWIGDSSGEPIEPDSPTPQPAKNEGGEA